MAITLLTHCLCLFNSKDFFRESRLSKWKLERLILCWIRVCLITDGNIGLKPTRILKGIESSRVSTVRWDIIIWYPIHQWIFTLVDSYCHGIGSHNRFQAYSHTIEIWLIIGYAIKGLILGRGELQAEALWVINRNLTSHDLYKNAICFYRLVEILVDDQKAWIIISIGVKAAFWFWGSISLSKPAIKVAILLKLTLASFDIFIISALLRIKIIAIFTIATHAAIAPLCHR